MRSLYVEEMFTWKSLKNVCGIQMMKVEIVSWVDKGPLFAVNSMTNSHHMQPFHINKRTALQSQRCY